MTLDQEPFFDAFGIDCLVDDQPCTVILIEDDGLDGGRGDDFSHVEYAARIDIQDADVGKFVKDATVLVSGKQLRVFDEPVKDSSGFWRVNLEP